MKQEKASGLASKKDGAIPPSGLEQSKGQWGPWEERGYRDKVGRHGLVYGPLESLRGNMRQP